MGGGVWLVWVTVVELGGWWCLVGVGYGGGGEGVIHVGRKFLLWLRTRILTP